MTDKIFELRLTDVAGEIRSETTYPDVILCAAGQHHRDFDVIEDLADQEWLSAVRNETATRMRLNGGKPDISMPIGFDIHALPIGSVITVRDK